MLKWSKPSSPKDNSFDFEDELTYIASASNIDISNDTRFSFGYEPNYAVNKNKSMSDMYVSSEDIYLQMQSNRYRSETQNKSHYEYEERSLNEYGLILDSLEELRKWIQLTTKTTSEETNVLNNLDDGLILYKLLSKIDDSSYKKKINRKISKFAWNRRELVFNFLRECKKLGIKESDLFTVDDWRYVIDHPECYFQDELWMYSIRKVLKTFYQLIIKSKRKVQVKEVNLDVFRQLFLIEDLANVTMCSECSPSDQDTVKNSPVNCDETETPQPITFRSYIKPKEKIEVLNKLQRLKNKNTRNKRSHGQTRSPYSSPTAPESPNTVSDDGYATSSGTCGSPFLQFSQKKSKATFSINRKANKKSITKEKTGFERISKTDKPLNSFEKQNMSDFVKPISKPSEEEINILNRFLQEFTNEKRENNHVQNKLEVKNELKKEYFPSKNSPHQKTFYHHAEINWIQASVKEALSYVQLTTELKNVVNDLLTVGNTYSIKKNENLLPKEDLENFFKTITIPEILSSVSEYTSEENSSTDEYISGKMPALLKEGSHEKKHRKEEKKKKHKSSSDKNTKNKLEDDNVQNGGNHYESIASPKSPDRISRSETRKSRNHKHDKHDKSNKRKSPKHEKNLEVVETKTENKEQIYEIISNEKNHSESLPSNDRKYNKLDSEPQEDSTINAVNLAAAKSKLKPPKYLNPPNDAPLKRNNSIHIKEPEYTWDTADGRHRVYLRSKEGVTSAPPARKDILNNRDENFKEWLRKNSAQDNIHERLGVSPDIVELLREEENFWQKQQELKKWRESHDKQINKFNKHTLPPVRPRPISTYARINACPVSESERELEEARIEREANRLMHFRAQQVHVLETSKENLFRDDEKKNLIQPYHSSILSSSHVNVRNLKQRSSVHFSSDNKPVYERSNLVRNIRRSRTMSCFSDDDEVFNDYRRDNSVHNRGYYSDHEAFLESSTFQAGPKQTGNKFRFRCTSCSRTINDERLISIEGHDFNWHIKCFFCVVCRAYLNDKHIVRVRVVDSRLHCRFCYSARNGELMSEV